MSADDTAHPSASSYRQGCRCDECRSRWAERARELRSARKSRRVLVDGYFIAPVAKHGTLSTYMNWNCQCAPCLNRAAEYQREWRRKNRT